MPHQHTASTGTSRLLRTALALAACQLLLACAQPVRNNFVNHFRTDSPEGTYVFPDEEASDPAQAAGERRRARGRPGAAGGFGARADAPGGAAADAPQARLYPGTGQLVAPSAHPPPRLPSTPITLDFEDAPLSEVVRTVLGDILSLDYVLHPPINGTVTLSSHRATSPDQALNLLEIALQTNGMAMVRDIRGSYHIGRVEALRGIGASVRSASAGAPLAPGYGTILVPLQYIGAGEMAAILRPLIPGEALLRVDTLRNLLVLVGSRAQAEGWLDLVRTFDVNLLEGMSVGVFALKHVTVDEVREALQLLSGGPGGGAGAVAAPAVAPPPPGATAQQRQAAAQAAAARQQAIAQAIARQQQQAAASTGLGEGNPLYGALRIIPIGRLNSVLIITPYPAYLEEARRWLDRLDQPGGGAANAQQLHIYRVQNGNAMHLASVLSGIFGGTTTTTQSSANSGVAPGLGSANTRTNSPASLGGGTSALGAATGLGALGPFGSRNNSGNTTGGGTGSVIAELGDMRIMADELNNSLLVWGTQADYERIATALKRLDVPPVQVLIEASIVEVTLNDTLRYGLQWAFSGDVGRYSGSGALGDASLGEAIASGFSYTLRNSAGAVRAALNALAGKTSVKVVASPTLMVLDNHTASIIVGTQQPYSAGSTATANIGVTTNVQYKDTGVNLQVTPSVNSGNMVTMSVEQTVTDVGSAVIVGGESQPTFLQRQISSRVAVRSGESIVMGGLIQENARSGSSGLPLLHDLPVVGNLFGSTETGGQRTELVVIITPRVVRSDVQVKAVSDDLREHMRALTPLLQAPPPASRLQEKAGEEAAAEETLEPL